MSKPLLYILKIGTTFVDTARALGDFDLWTSAALGTTTVEVSVLDIENGAALPSPKACAGVVITGSHAMVTDEPPWSVAVEKWIPLLLDARVPLFGICYGHQLLARATGGRVDYHPLGKEIGSVAVRRLPHSADDPVFGALPETFTAHVTHAQSVLRPPPQAVRLAANDFEPHHALRIGDRAWGVQFHPEFNAAVMRHYIQEQAADLHAAGRDIEALLSSVQDTPAAARTLRRFAGVVETALSRC